jgi:hypothetical protein
VRKIISILLALGLVLTFSVVAMPATAGAACTAAVISQTDDCAGEDNVVCINFTIPVTLLAGNDKLSATFPAGTTFPTWTTGDITVADDGAVAIHANVTQAVVTGTHVEFPIPPMPAIDAGSVVTLCIEVTNPAGGTYQIDLDYQLACCAAEVFDCAAWVVKPAISTYSLMVDFGLTYDGIAEDFVPPFKACGQNSTAAAANHSFNTTFVGGAWHSPFELILVEETEGCDPPCVNATLSFNVTAFPAEGTPHVSLNISGESFILTPTSSGGTYSQNVTLLLGQNISFVSLLHFDEVGQYTICFEFTCPGTPGGSCQTDPPCVAGEDFIIAEGCYDFEVHQWKDAAKIVLQEKWNLISLPLVPFDTDIDILLESLSAAGLADLISIWSYDTASATWTMYSGGGLTEMVDGKSYWVRMDYPTGAAFNWWVWGHARAMPPLSPSAYPMSAGWEMFGFTSLVNMQIDGVGGYLWNFTTLPLTYGWINTGSWMTSGWDIILAGETLTSGQGYWGYFPTGGTVVPP